jgi:hypothetical protein
MHRDPHHLNVRFSFQGPSGRRPSVAGAKNLEDLHPSVNRKSSFSFEKFPGFRRAKRTRREPADGTLVGAFAEPVWPNWPGFLRGIGLDQRTFPTGFPRGERAPGAAEKSGFAISLDSGLG